MPADKERVTKRVLDILNLVSPGTYSTTISPRIKTRNTVAINDMIIDAGLILLRAVAEVPNEYRHALVNQMTVTNGQLLPDHQGQPISVEIQKFSGADWEPAERRDYKRVDSYRQNTNNIYDDLDHDQEGSSLSGLYDIWERKFYFTGFAARAELAQVARADVDDKIPEILEPVWVRLSVGEAAKAGTGSMDIIGHYGQKGMNDLNEFKAGGRAFSEVSDPEPSSAKHE